VSICPSIHARITIHSQPASAKVNALKNLGKSSQLEKKKREALVYRRKTRKTLWSLCEVHGDELEVIASGGFLTLLGLLLGLRGTFLLAVYNQAGP